MEYEYKNKEWLIKQIELYKNVTDISINTGYPKTSLRRYIEKFNLSYLLEKKKKIRKDDLNKYPFKDKEWLVEQLLKYHTPNEISRNTKCSETSIRRYIKKFNIENLIDSNFKQIKKDNYETYPFKNKEWLIKAIKKYKTIINICSQTGYASTSIRRYIKLYELEYLLEKPKNKRINTLNEDYFESIDNEHKAYWLGLITADGCVRNKDNHYSISISLKKEDKYLLELFLNDIESNSKIYINNRDICYARVFSKKMFNDLNKLGIKPRKTGNEEIPILNKELYRHFVRGFFDGDGTIFKKHNRKRHKCSIGFVCMNKKFIDDLLILIKNNININIPNFYKSQKNVYEPKTESFDKCLKFVEWIYYDSTIAMIRKYNKAVKFLNYKCPSLEEFRLIAGKSLEL